MAMGRFGFDVKKWLQWTGVFLVFPVAGLLARTVAGPADNFGAALFSGAIAGVLIGVGTWIALGRAVPLSWIPVTAGGLAVGLAFGAALVGYRIGIAHLVVMGALSGLGVGLGQWWVLRGWISRPVFWPLVTALAWAIGWAVTTALGVDVAMRWPVFGVSGAVVAMALSGALLTVLKPDRSRGLNTSGLGADEPVYA
jgi:hypothetical protein